MDSTRVAVNISWPLALGAVLVTMSTPAAVASEPSPCEPSADARGTGALPSGVGPADFGMVPEACPAFDLLARARGVLLVASTAPDFYGSAAGGMLLRVRHGLDERTWLSLALDAATYRFVANAVVQSTALSVGPPTLGIYHRLPVPTRAAIAVYGRVLLPFDTARENGIEVGGETGVTAFIPLGRFGLQGGLALPVPVDITGGQVHAAFLPAALTEGFWSSRSGGAALFLGAALRSEAIPEQTLRSVAARAGVRFAWQSGLMLAIASEVPLQGTDRTDLVASIFVGWTFPEAPAVPPQQHLP